MKFFDSDRLQVRESNMELLRLIAMFMVVMDHVLLVGDVPLMSYHGPLTGLMISRYLGLSITFVGVNLFVMISGYYGIKFRWSKLIGLYLTCVFYGLLCEGVHMLYTPDFGWKHNTLYVIQNALSNKMWWFINTYICLMLFSPLLNKALDNISKRYHQGIIVLLLLQVCFFDWGWQVCNNFINFLCIYVIGRYLNKYINNDFVIKCRWLFLLLWILCISVFFCLSILHTKGYCSLLLWEYNNPLLIIGAIGLILFFSSVHFSSRLINWLASGTLAVYLIHVGPWVGIDLFSFLQSSIPSLSDVMYWPFVIGIGVGMVVLFSMIDIIRRWLLLPIMDILKRFIKSDSYPF